MNKKIKILIGIVIAFFVIDILFIVNNSLKFNEKVIVKKEVPNNYRKFLNKNDNWKKFQIRQGFFYQYQSPLIVMEEDKNTMIITHVKTVNEIDLSSRIVLKDNEPLNYRNQSYHSIKDYRFQFNYKSRNEPYTIKKLNIVYDGTGSILIKSDSFIMTKIIAKEIGIKYNKDSKVSTYIINKNEEVYILFSALGNEIFIQFLSLSDNEVIASLLKQYAVKN